MKAKYVIEIEVDEMDRDDLGVVGVTLVTNGTHGIKSGRKVKTLSCKAHTTDVVEIDV